MARLHLGLLSLGVVLIILSVWTAALLLGLIGFEHLIPLLMLSGGIWTVVVAGLRAAGLGEHGGVFTTFGWGVFFIVVGGSMYMVSLGMHPLYTLVFVLALVGVLTVIAALRSTRS